MSAPGAAGSAGPFLVLGTGLLTYIMQAFKFPKSIYSAWTEKRVREWEKNDLNSTDYLPTNPFSELLPIEKQCEMRDAWDLGVKITDSGSPCQHYLRSFLLLMSTQSFVMTTFCICIRTGCTPWNEQ